MLLPNFSFAQQTPQIEAPETLEEAREMGEKFAKTTEKEMPGILERIWKEEVLPIWQKMWDWAKNFWQSYLKPKIEAFLRKEVEPKVKEEIEKRKPQIEEEFEKEKEELEKEFPKVSKSLWKRFKELIK